MLRSQCLHKRLPVMDTEQALDAQQLLHHGPVVGLNGQQQRQLANAALVVCRAVAHKHLHVCDGGEAGSHVEGRRAGLVASVCVRAEQHQHADARWRRSARHGPVQRRVAVLVRQLCVCAAVQQYLHNVQAGVVFERLEQRRAVLARCVAVVDGGAVPQQRHNGGPILLRDSLN